MVRGGFEAVIVTAAATEPVPAAGAPRPTGRSRTLGALSCRPFELLLAALSPTEVRVLAREDLSEADFIGSA